MKKMKKYTASALAAVLLLASLALLAGCGRRVTYADADSYTAGGLITDTETVKTVEIFWQSGSVEVTGVLTDKVIVMDDRLPGDELGMRYRLSDGVLQIYPCASGENTTKLEKKLIVKIPYEMANALESIKITTDSADVSCSLVGTQTLNIVTDSGNIDYMGAATTASITTDSGELSMKVSAIDELRFVSDSGDADVALQTTGFNAVLTEKRGEIDFKGAITVYQNGNIYSYGDMSSQLIFTTKSGDVELSLWES